MPSPADGPVASTWPAPKNEGLPRVTLKGLRHTHATLLLELGEHPKVVQERLGHSTITTTMNIYRPKWETPGVTTVIFDDVVHTDYGQFDIVWSDDFGFDGDFDKFFAGQINGLAGAASGEGLYLNLARRSGGSPVRIELCDAEPTLEPEWEDVVEVSITVPENSEPRWSTWAGEDSGALAIPPGTYRVRVNARGRDVGCDGEFAEENVDFYLLQLWVAPPTPDKLLRKTSADANYTTRSAAGGSDLH